jgi:outer membrane lipoprotein SlyB
MKMQKRFVWSAPLLTSIAILAPIFGASSRTETLSVSSMTASNPAPQSKQRVTVPAGTRVLIRTVDSIDTTKQKTGFRFTATLETNLQAEDRVVAPRGTTVYGRLAQASSSGRMKGSSELTLELTDIVINGTAYPLLTSTYEIKGKGEGKNTAKKVVGGAGLGALIGGLAGGGKGAGIGALAGAGAGTAVAATKKGEQLQIPSESLLEFRLEQPVALPVAR